ncbi:unnamed protein product [Leptosia nina]|uniref:Copper homeostasis protein cutC homolog n=1 Tax=Leptosia nina TaxID=320188 RepID=A0AAV1JC12_9NEOP
MGNPVINGKLEVCIDSLESAANAIRGGAHELEICSSLVEGGLTPSPGLVTEILNIVKTMDSTQDRNVKLNIMIRCRGGPDFCYTDEEMKTMISDVKIYKSMGVDRFVFGALTDKQEVDVEKCTAIIQAASPIPVTFHRAFDVSSNPWDTMSKIVDLGFNRVLTSGQKISAADCDAIELLKELQVKFGGIIEIMPGSGVCVKNAKTFLDIGFKMLHSSCKRDKDRVKIANDLGMGSKESFVTEAKTVKSMVEIIKPI